jgi:hypothetical protein
MNPMPFTLGLDLAQSADHSAIALLEQTAIPQAFDRVTWSQPSTIVCDLRYLRRFPKGTPYPDIVDFLETTLQAPPLHRQTTLVCDATGLGAPFIDMLRRAQLDAPILPIILTGAQSSAKPGSRSVPKTDLIAALSYRLHTGTLRIPNDLPNRDLLYHELLHFRAKLSPGGSTRLEAQRSDDHDDLLIALALACWHTRPRQQGGHQPNRLL